MRRTDVTAALAVATAVALVACSSTSGTTAAPSTSASSTVTSSAPATSTSAAPATSPRGLLVKGIGDTAGFANEQSGASQATFTVDAIEVDPKCSGPYPESPQHGHFVVMSFTIATTPQYLANQHWFVTPHDFAIVGPDGVTETAVVSGAAFACLPQQETLPTSPFAPASTYRGKLPLDTRNTRGTITYRPAAIGLTGGWEWSFGT